MVIPATENNDVGKGRLWWRGERNLSVASRHGETGVNYRSALRQLHGLWEAFGFCRPQFFKL